MQKVDRRWTDADVTELKQLVESTYLTYSDIGKRINRTEMAVRSKVKALQMKIGKAEKEHKKVPILGNVPPARISDAYGRMLLEVGDGGPKWHRELWR